MAEILIISMKIRGEWKPCLMSQFLVWFFCFHDIFSPHPKIFQCHIKTRTFLISLSLITLFRYTQSKVFSSLSIILFEGEGGLFSVSSLNCIKRDKIIFLYQYWDFYDGQFCCCILHFQWSLNLSVKKMLQIFHFCVNIFLFDLVFTMKALQLDFV